MNKIDYIILSDKTYPHNNKLYFQQIKPSLLDIRIIKHIISNPDQSSGTYFLLNLYCILKYLEKSNIQYDKLIIVDEKYNEKEIIYHKAIYAKESKILRLDPLFCIILKSTCDLFLNNLPVLNIVDWYKTLNFNYNTIFISSNRSISSWEIVFS